MVSLDSLLETPEWSQIRRQFCESVQVGALDTLLATRSELTALHHAVLELPPHYREAVVLCSLQEDELPRCCRGLGVLGGHGCIADEPRQSHFGSQTAPVDTE